MRGLAILVSLALPATAVFADTGQERLAEANQVFSEIMRRRTKESRRNCWKTPTVW